LPVADCRTGPRAEIAVNRPTIISTASQGALDIHHHITSYFTAYHHGTWSRFVIIGSGRIVVRIRRGSHQREPDPDAHTGTAPISSTIITTAMPVSGSRKSHQAHRHDSQRNRL